MAILLTSSTATAFVTRSRHDGCRKRLISLRFFIQFEPQLNKLIPATYHELDLNGETNFIYPHIEKYAIQPNNIHTVLLATDIPESAFSTEQLADARRSARMGSSLSIGSPYGSDL